VYGAEPVRGLLDSRIDRGSSVTSVGKKSLPPELCESLSPFSRFRSRSETLAPALTSRRAEAAPRPETPPLITATKP